jgi:hypothetical protein
MYVIPFFLGESMYTKRIHHQALALFFNLKRRATRRNRNAPTRLADYSKSARTAVSLILGNLKTVRETMLINKTGAFIR